MRSVIDHRPMFPSGSPFLSAGTIQRCSYAEGIYECYQIQLPDQQKAIGVMIICKTDDEALAISRKHLTWWQKLSNYGFKVLTHSIETLTEKKCFLALLVVSGKDLNLGLRVEPRLNSEKAESILREMLQRCQTAQQVECWPWIEIGAVILSQRLDATTPIPFLLRPEFSDVDLEAKCVESIARFVYALATGINLKELNQPKIPTSTSIQPAHLWNKEIDQSLSLLLSLCMERQNPRRIQTLNDLALRMKIEIVPQTAQPQIPAHIASNLSGFAKVAGMVQLKSLLFDEVINPIRDPEPYKKFGLTIPNGILLYGPPGCGKTFIARQLAEELKFNFLELIPSEIASPFIHDTVLKIRDAFSHAEEQAPSIIFIDEFEALVPSRSELGGHQQYKSEEVNEFLVHLNECASKRILIIAATNEPQKIDGAICRPGRIDKLVYVGPPDAEARIDLLKMYLSNKPVGKLDYGYFGQLLDGYSCSDIKNIVDDAARLAMKAKKAQIDIEHLAEAIQRNPSSLTQAIVSQYTKFQQRGI